MRKKNLKSKEVTVDAIRDKIIKAIKKKYNMSVYEFASSGEPEKVDLKGPNVRVNLSHGGTVSYKTFSALYRLLDLGELDRKTVVTKKTTFFEATKKEGF